MAPSTCNSGTGSSNLTSAQSRLDISDFSGCVDLTTDDSDDDHAASGEGLSSLKVSAKRRLSDLAMDEAVDQDQLQISIERDILQSTKLQRTWSFGTINQSFGSSKSFALARNQQKSSTPASIQEYDSDSTQQSSQISSESDRTPKDMSDGYGASMKNWGFARANSVPPANDDDLQMLDAEPSTFFFRPSKRARPISSPIMPQTRSIGRGKKTLRLSEDDYLDDNGLEAFLKSTINGCVIDIGENKPNIELLPDSAQDIINLEKEEAAEEAPEIEDEDTNQFMNAPAVDEADEYLMKIIEIFSDDEDDIPKPRRPQTQPCPERRKSSVQQITTRFDNFGFDMSIPFIQHGMQIYKPGDGVEFHNGTFMKIKSIYTTPKGNIILSGLFLTRYTQHCLDPNDPINTPLVPSKGRGNELVWTVTIDRWPKREEEYVDRELSEVMRPREIILTNQTWPCVSSQIHTGNVKRKHIFHHGPLFCRWKRIKQVQDKQLNCDYEDCVQRLSEIEADVKHSVKASKLRFAARRQHVPPGGGSATHLRNIESEDGTMLRKIISQYTFADCFCGCGGASRGAELAGLLVQWALDCDEKAARSFQANFRSAECCHEDVFDLLDRLGEPGVAAAYIVDVLHMSPPCQAFSLARTRGSDNAKEHLQAPITSVGDLLKKVKPRIATMEETAGLFYAHKDWMAHVIREILDAGYSVRWKIVESKFHGVPQLRKRLVIIAAGPGETLPPWPKPTHEPGMRALATIDDAIRYIPASVSHHQTISRFKDGPRAPFSSYTQAKTLTCGVGESNYHPTGLRPYTVRELACLQTFPLLHSFANANLTTAKRQIGNAFPPMMARAVYRSIIKSLKETDGVDGEEN